MLLQHPYNRISSFAVSLTALAWALATALVLAAPAAAMLVEMEVEDLSAASRDVVIGDVIAVRSVPDTIEGVATEVSVRADRALKGRSGGRTVTFRVPGGALGDLAVYVPDAPTFARGDRVVVFLDAKGRVVGGRQGRLGVIEGRVPEIGNTLARLEMRVTGDTYSGAECHGAEEVDMLSGADTETSSGSLTALSGPAIAGISPGAAAAGVGHQVLVSGSGFGNSPGSVLFSTNSDGTQTIGGDIVSWSDTAIRVAVPARQIDGSGPVVSASSGPVRVRTSGGLVSDGRSFTVTFSYGGRKWYDPAQTFYLDTLGGTAPAGALNATKAAAQTWTASSGFALTYAGTGAMDSANDRNEVGWRSLGTGTLGRAYLRFYLGSDELIATDMAFNTDYAWGDGSGTTRDLETVALHEMGHWLNLVDLYGGADRPNVMYGIYTGVKRALHDSDLAGARWIYGSAGSAEIVRIAGDSRYETALNTSRENFLGGTVSDVVLASGASYPDALAASGLAGSYGSPLLLTRTTSLSPGVAEELTRLGARRVIVVGGPSAVADAVLTALTDRGLTVSRVSGADRYDTAAQVAARIAAREGAGFARSVFVARGDSFADALAAAPYAYRLKRPVLLVSPTDTRAATRDALKALGITDAVIVGGTVAVSTGVSDEIAAIVGATPLRLQGEDRYATAAAVVTHALASGWCSPAEIGITAGTDFPDALGGGAALGARNGLVLLTRPTSLCPNTRALLDAYAGRIDRIQVFGGVNAVCPDVFSAVCTALGD